MDATLRTPTVVLMMVVGSGTQANILGILIVSCITKCTMGQEAEPQKRPNIPRILPVPMHPFGNNVMYPAKVFNSEELPQNTFTKEAGKQLEESKLRVVMTRINQMIMSNKPLIHALIRQFRLQKLLGIQL